MFFAIYAYFCYNGQKITILHLGVVDPNYHNITILGAGRGDYTIYGWPLTRRQQGKRHQLWFMMKVWMWQMKSTSMHSSLRRPDIQTERERESQTCQWPMSLPCALVMAALCKLTMIWWNMCKAFLSLQNIKQVPCPPQFEPHLDWSGQSSANH